MNIVLFLQAGFSSVIDYMLLMALESLPGSLVHYQDTPTGCRAFKRSAMLCLARQGMADSIPTLKCAVPSVLKLKIRQYQETRKHSPFWFIIEIVLV